VSTMANLFW